MDDRSKASIINTKIYIAKLSHRCLQLKHQKLRVSSCTEEILECFAATIEVCCISNTHFSCVVRTSITIRGRPETFLLPGPEQEKFFRGLKSLLIAKSYICAVVSWKATFLFCGYSGTSLLQTSLGPNNFTEVSLFQGEDITHLHVYVAVPNRNRILFRHVFRAHQQV